MQKYTIQKILSNNVVLVETDQQNYILVGKGIGFGKKKGTVIEDSTDIEKKFISLEGLSLDESKEFLTSVDPKVIEICKKIFEMIAAELGEDLNPNIHVGLIDHVNFMIKRLQEGIDIVNPFLFETKLLYPLEYALAEKALEILKRDLKIDIPEAEIGFLALHICGGRGQQSKTEALENSKMLSDILKYVEKELKIDIKQYSFDLTRFTMHLKGVINRVVNNQWLENIFLATLKKDLKHEFKIAYQLSAMIERSLKVNVPESEVGYIALHLYKLKNHGK